MEPEQLLEELRATHREQMEVSTAERALEQAEQPPTAQFLGFDNQGEAVFQFATGQTASGDPIFNTLPQPGDVVDVHGGSGVPSVDQASAWQEEAEPEVVEMFSKIKILYRMPDGSLWIGGDRRTGRRIGTWNSAAEYYLANTGDGDREWAVTKITRLQKQLPNGQELPEWEIGWVGGRTLRITNSMPAPSRYVSVTVEHIGGGYVAVLPSLGVKRFHFEQSDGYFGVGETMYHLQPSLAIAPSGTFEDNRSLTSGSFQTQESFSSFLLSNSQSLVQSGFFTDEFEFSISDSGASSESRKEAHRIPVWISPKQAKSTTYSYAYSSVRSEENSDYTSISVGGVGYWFERRVKQSFTTNEIEIESAYLNGIPVSGTAPRGAKRTIAQNKLFALTLTNTELTTGGQATVNVGRPGTPWGLSAIRVPFYRVPTDATVLDYSYHP